MTDPAYPRDLIGHGRHPQRIGAHVELGHDIARQRAATHLFPAGPGARR